MPNNFVLRELPDDIWIGAKTRADHDGWPMKALVVQLLKDYGANRISPTARPPAQMVPASDPRRMSAARLDVLRAKVVRLIESPAWYLDPELATDTQGASLFLRLAQEWRTLGREMLVDPEIAEARAAYWKDVPLGDHLSRRLLSKFADEADHLIAGLLPDRAPKRVDVNLLSLHEIGWGGADREVYQYEVRGGPEGFTAHLAHMNGVWQTYLERSSSFPGFWREGREGFETVTEAFSALKSLANLRS